MKAKDKDVETLLHQAAMKGQKDVAEQLIDKGADVNAIGPGGWTPLAWAKASPNPNRDMEDLLRKHGARV